MIWNVAAYCRLSREDGDRIESDSIAGQKELLKQYLAQNADKNLHLADYYIDDGYSGTSFNRPAFAQMLADIEAGRINCVLVKDLSRFGRDYIDVGNYLERVFPGLGVRFIAIGDQVDSERGAYDMMLPLKNVFNAEYARDISKKVKSALKTKQHNGDFIGAFASYGYIKDKENKNRLIVDPVAAQVVRQIFARYEGGMGKIAIAKALNRADIPCPSAYKRQMGERYHNGQRVDGAAYWTYATVHRILQNQIYAGHMVQGKTKRPLMHGKAKQLAAGEWVVVPDTHEAIISPEQFARVQNLLQKNSRSCAFEENVALFAGFLRCGDCGRAMCKTKRGKVISYSCGSYKRYGASICTAHYIRQDELERLLLEDLNALIGQAENLTALAEAAAKDIEPKRNRVGEAERLQTALARVQRLKRRSYEDYAEGLLSKADYLRMKAEYDAQEAQVSGQLAQLEAAAEETEESPWVQDLLAHKGLRRLDRPTLGELVESIRIFEDERVEVSYRFALPPADAEGERHETQHT